MAEVAVEVPNDTRISADAPKPDAKQAGKAAEGKAPEGPTLRDLDIVFPSGKLTMVVGAVGCGKSSLLSALLGELDAEGEGSAVRLSGRAAYFSQTAFILNDTLRANILLGGPLEEERYQATLRACALLPDLAILPGGDMTQIGEKGINLSGGQKARVALARACYARAPLVLLDDPLSAVDAHVGQHIFSEVLGPAGLLASSTRVLVTHQTQFLPHADHILVLEAGSVLAQGSFADLRASSVDLSSIASLSSTDDARSEVDSAAEGGGPPP